MKTLPPFVTQLKSFGFRVFVNKNQEEPTYAFYSENNKIGYIQEGWGCEYNFSTVHKANRQTGTGFGILGGPMTKENAESGFVFAPSWAYSSDLPSIVKYRDVEELLKVKGNLIEV
jgi:hypothetical protein